MAKQRATSEAAAREARQALRALADAVHSSAKDGDLPKKLRKALREVEPLIDRADRKLGKRQAELVKAARKEREKRAAKQAKAARKAKERSAAAKGATPNDAAAPAKAAAPARNADAPTARPGAKPQAAAVALPTEVRRQGPGTTSRTSLAGERARKRARRSG